ncbi:MAG: hypothetical protein CVT64_01695 [Actinobacteria bacterium HGW-Actinobacteria-4]|nr:MAG: hypothetical protein CVT64_01695 [Actinobacteria bacterium HGW-Actinobacteria-4]
MTEYVRPEVDIPIFLAADGTPIPYGHRWGQSVDGDWTPEAPDSAYSVATHPERFAPIVTVANALIEHVASAYDVTVDADAPVPAWMLDRDSDADQKVVRAVVITPKDPQCSPLTLVETRYPSVELHAGVQAFEPFPACGCDACDDDLFGLFESLEHHVLAVVKGNLVEQLTWRGLFTQWTFPDGSSSSTMPRRQVSREHIAQLRKLRRTHPDCWQPWPLRSA